MIVHPFTNVLTSDVSDKADGGCLYVSLVVCGEGTAEEQVDLDQVLLSIQSELLLEGQVRGCQDVLPVLR